jgi:hypothetical protein
MICARGSFILTEVNDGSLRHGYRVQESVPLWLYCRFFATLIFHQLTLAVLWGLGSAPFPPYSLALTRPFGIPAVFSFSFWGGLWGILFALIHRGFPRDGAYWVASFFFGAIFPSLVAFLVVLPLKGRAMGVGWHLSLLVTAFVVNGVWGIGTGLILKALSTRFHVFRKRST